MGTELRLEALFMFLLGPFESIRQMRMLLSGRAYRNLIVPDPVLRIALYPGRHPSRQNSAPDTHQFSCRSQNLCARGPSVSKCHLK